MGGAPLTATLPQRTAFVALAGNPNTGKTALFNRLTGLRAKVGNYPGVTVERREAELELGDAASGTACTVRLVDVPGTYSLNARSADEEIAMRVLAGLDTEQGAPSAVVVVLDGTQLERNLYLALAVIALDVPVLVAVNMADALEREGKRLDLARLEQELGVPAVAVSALRGTGFDELRAKLAELLEHPERGRPGGRVTVDDTDLLADLDEIGAHVPESWMRDPAGEPAVGTESGRRRRALALWALQSVDEDDELRCVPAELRSAVEVVQRRHAAADHAPDEAVITARYRWIEERMPRFVVSPDDPRRSLTDRIDAVLLSPWIGFPLFLAAMTVLFESIFSWADPMIGAIEGAVAWLGARIAGILPDGLFESFLVDGVIAGVGGVLVFLPQIVLLFLLIGLMEDTGYLARVAHLTDRLMRAVGLHGRAFVPMLSGYACAIPAVMATRTMERQRDRLLTMMVVPLMSCSARLPVYTLLIAAMVPVGSTAGWSRGGLLVGMYLFSTAMALACAFVLGRTVLRGPRVPLLLELPAYRRPQLLALLRRVWERAMLFVKGAGGVILACTIALWFLLSFPRPAEPASPPGLRAVEAEAPGSPLEQSYAGRLGRAFEPAIEPLGFDWKIGIGLIGAFAAREVFVSTMAVVYGLEDDADEHSPLLRERIAAQTWPDGRRVFTPLVCLSLMVFFALACQCMSTLAAVKRETGGWRWPTFLFVYMTVLAWVSSFAVYQGGRLLGFE